MPDAGAATAGRPGHAPRARGPGRTGPADARRLEDPRPRHRVRLPVAGDPRLRPAQREERAGLPRVRGAPGRDVRGGRPVLRRPLPARRLAARGDRHRSYVPQRAAGAALWNPGRDGPAVAARGRSQEGRAAAACWGWRPCSSKQSGASRTSPILRGNWLLEMLLGEKLPKPPKNVPQLPESELRHRRSDHAADHREAPQRRVVLPSATSGSIRSASRWRASMRSAAAARPTWADGRSTPRVQLKDGTTFADIAGLRDYLLSKRRDEFVRHFCRKLLGYSLGRSVQLSDKGAARRDRAAPDRERLSVSRTRSLTIVQSPQFRLRRGLASPLEQASSR